MALLWHIHARHDSRTARHSRTALRHGTEMSDGRTDALRDEEDWDEAHRRRARQAAADREAALVKHHQECEAARLVWGLTVGYAMGVTVALVCALSRL